MEFQSVQYSETRRIKKKYYKIGVSMKIENNEEAPSAFRTARKYIIKAFEEVY